MTQIADENQSTQRKSKSHFFEVYMNMQIFVYIIDFCIYRANLEVVYIRSNFIRPS